MSPAKVVGKVRENQKSPVELPDLSDMASWLWWMSQEEKEEGREESTEVWALPGTLIVTPMQNELYGSWGLCLCGKCLSPQCSSGVQTWKPVSPDKITAAARWWCQSSSSSGSRLCRSRESSSLKPTVDVRLNEGRGRIVTAAHNGGFLVFFWGGGGVEDWFFNVNKTLQINRCLQSGQCVTGSWPRSLPVQRGPSEKHRRLIVARKLASVSKLSLPLHHISHLQPHSEENEKVLWQHKEPPK